MKVYAPHSLASNLTSPRYCIVVLITSTFMFLVILLTFTVQIDEKWRTTKVTSKGGFNTTEVKTLSGHDNESSFDNLRSKDGGTTRTSPKISSKMLHFMIGGFGKCGTTTLMKSLNTRQTFMGFENDEDISEIHLLRKDKLNVFNDIYKDHIGKMTEDGLPILNGFKSPELLQSDTFLRNVETHFSDTNIIISTRHPVLHFQSLYNFKLRDKKFSSRKRPDPLSLIGDCAHTCTSDCVPKSRGVCTKKSYFHYGLSRLMLTPMNTSEEAKLLDYSSLSKHSGFKGNLFLLELGQLADDNITRQGAFLNKMEDFIGLETNSVSLYSNSGNRTREKYIDICEESNRPIRDILVEMGTKAAKWIREYLIHSPRVVVANRDHFVQLINKWESDPCEERNMT